MARTRALPREFEPDPISRRRRRSFTATYEPGDVLKPVCEISPRGCRRQRLSFGPVEIDRFIDDFAQLREDGLLVSAVAARENEDAEGNGVRFDFAGERADLGRSRWPRIRT
ncbi:MAG: hypothetical protein HY749_10685 [Gammaproteobacteria bacterium]|nr:hypothetical protein [Gammaproteobacteria bacterium]MBI5616925.1 hypothetical protein [Gammaproteobacteria bacterium]